MTDKDLTIRLTVNDEIAKLIAEKRLTGFSLSWERLQDLMASKQSEGEIPLISLDDLIDGVRRVWYLNELGPLCSDPKEYKRLYCPDSTFLDE